MTFKLLQSYMGLHFKTCGLMARLYDTEASQYSAKLVFSGSCW